MDTSGIIVRTSGNPYDEAMPWPAHETPDADALARLRELGEQTARETLNTAAPAGPLERLAFVSGFGSTDELQRAVDACRSDGWTWAQIGAALGIHGETARTRFGDRYEAQRRYRERRRAEG